MFAGLAIRKLDSKLLGGSAKSDQVIVNIMRLEVFGFF